MSVSRQYTLRPRGTTAREAVAVAVAQARSHANIAVDLYVSGCPAEGLRHLAAAAAAFEPTDSRAAAATAAGAALDDLRDAVAARRTLRRIAQAHEAFEAAARHGALAGPATARHRLRTAATLLVGVARDIDGNPALCRAATGALRIARSLVVGMRATWPWDKRAPVRAQAALDALHDRLAAGDDAVHALNAAAARIAAAAVNSFSPSETGERP